jgi:Holliday junction resolvase
MDSKGNKIELWDKDSTEPALKQLARIVEEKQIKNRPLIPPHARKKPVFRDQTANELTRSIIAFIEAIGGQAERINNMGRQITNGTKTKWVYGTGKNGTADISATWAGMSIKIEVKATKGEKQSESQKQYQESIEKAGGIYLIARNLDGFVFKFFKAVEGLGHGG